MNKLEISRSTRNYYELDLSAPKEKSRCKLHNGVDVGPGISQEKGT